MNHLFVQPIALQNEVVVLVNDNFRMEVEMCKCKKQWGGLFHEFPFDGKNQEIANMNRHRLALVTGWKATKFNDEERNGQILRYHTHEVCAQGIRKLCKAETIPEIAEDIFEEHDTEFFETGAQLLAMNKQGVKETLFQKTPKV